MKIFCRCSKTRVVFAIVFAIFATFIASLLSISNTYAAATVTGGIFTGAGDVRWEWQRSFDSDSEDEKVVIKFYDRPENLAEVTVPSLADVISASGATATLNTYFLDSADTDQQDAAYSATYPKRAETAKVTKLDMSNTSKIQILGVAPILDPETEAELVFGENMVIGDSATISKHVEMKLCNEYYNWGDVYVCSVDYFNVTPADVDPSMVAGWEDMSLAERYAYQPTPEDLGYPSTDEYSSIPASEYDPSLTYLSPREITTTTEVVDHGAFSGYKLKLTNLDNVKYIGWYAFKDSTFNAVNLEITIEENQTTGQSAFENTNIEKAVLKNTETSVDMFKDCANLSEVEFVNTEIIRDGSFENTTVGPSLDLSNTNVKKVLSRAFKNTGLTEINIEGVEKLGAEAFANNDIKEVYFPKSINDLSESSVFFGNNNLTKLTVAFDTLTSGTTNSFFSIIGDDVASESDTYVAGQIKELELIAPYGENESVSATHLSYMDYIANHYTGASENSENTQRLRNDSAYKNIVAPGYFYGFYNVEKLTIGDGYEMVGAQSFFGYGVKTGIITGVYLIDQFKSTIDGGYYTALKNVSLPDTLKAIDFYGFGFHSNPEFSINLPQSLEFIGNQAFYYAIGMHNDIDLPNLKYLGYNSFYISGIRDVVLHDKLEYIGTYPFMGTYYLRNVTIDLDVFNGQTNGLFNGTPFATAFLGHLYAGSGNFKKENLPTALQSLEIPTVIGARSTLNDIVYYHKLGTVTFTEKVQTEPSYRWTFNGVAADKIDLSKTGWKTIVDNSFVETVIGELLLPENLEAIGSTAFHLTRIDSELVLPQTLKTIGEGAFNNFRELAAKYYYSDNGVDYYHYGEKVTGEVPNNAKGNYTHGVIIKSLPNSLESLGYCAFYGDYNLDVDFNLTNIKYVGTNALMMTGVKDITLHDNITFLGQGAFSNAMYIHDVVIDLDYYNCSKYGAVCSSFYGVFNSVDPTLGGPSQNTYGSKYNSITFTSKAVSEPYNNGAIFSDFELDTFDISATSWTTIPSVYGMVRTKARQVLLPPTLVTVPVGYFFETEVEEPIVLPATVKTIDAFAFQWSKLSIENALNEGVKTINQAAFYGAKVADDLVIPNTVTYLGRSSFNAGNKDVSYNSVTIRPDLDYAKTADQAIFQLFWNAKMKQLVIESAMLPVLGTLQTDPILPREIEISGVMVSPLRDDGEPEFHAMNMEEVVIRNLPAITDNAFEECTNLKKVDFSDDANLVEIGKFAFNNDTSLKTLVFGDINNGKDINLKEYAFKNTAIQTIAGNGSDFDLSAAKFNAVEPHVFASLPQLKKVVVPNTFSIFDAADDANGTNGSTIPSYTFADDTELEEVRINYQLSEIKNDAFVNDNKIKKFFIWGNTTIEELNENDPTIPAPTNVFAYSDSPAENYVMKDSRENYEGKFYPLDEVLYITSNKKYVLLTDDKQDFDKTGLHLYAMRRDGVILESDEWLEYTTAYPRSEKPEVFGEGKGALYDDELAMDVYDAEKPFELVSLLNRNFEATTFDLIQEDGKDTMTLIIHYTDGYTVAIRNTAPDAIGEDELEEYLRKLYGEAEDELDVPNTGISNIGGIAGAAASGASIALVVLAGVIYLARKRR